MVFPNFGKGIPDHEVEGQLSEIVNHYTEIMNVSGTLLYYICFDIAIGYVPVKKGYALDPYWAQGVYNAALVDHRVYTKLLEIVSENLRYSRYLPKQLKMFASEVLSGSFPTPKKRGPARTRDQLRNLCISECMMLLTDELEMPIKSDAKRPTLAANDLICRAFSDAQIQVPGVAKPTAGTVARVWGDDRDKARYEVKVLRWLESKAKSNRWYNSVPFLYWINRIS